MTRKCRSCGHVQTRQSTHCERCGCDLGYSAHFEERLQQRSSTSRYLFPLEPEWEPDLEFPLPDTGTAPPATESIEKKAPSEPDAHPVRHREAPRPASSDNPSYGPALALAMELLLIMGWFFILSVSTKVIAPELAIPNWKLGIVSLVFWTFGTVMSRLGTGRTIGRHLTAKLSESHP